MNPKREFFFLFIFCSVDCFHFFPCPFHLPNQMKYNILDHETRNKDGNNEINKQAKGENSSHCVCACADDIYQFLLFFIFYVVLHRTWSAFPLIELTSFLFCWLACLYPSPRHCAPTHPLSKHNRSAILSWFSIFFFFFLSSSAQEGERFVWQRLCFAGSICRE